MTNNSSDNRPILTELIAAFENDDFERFKAAAFLASDEELEILESFLGNSEAAGDELLTQ